MQIIRNVLEEIITSYFGYTIFVDWNRLSVTSDYYTITMDNHFPDFTGYGGFIQLVDTPTRDNHILDIFATNQPTFFMSCHTRDDE